MTRIQHPFHTVKIITNDGKFGGTNLIMTEGELEPEVKILIKKKELKVIQRINQNLMKKEIVLVLKKITKKIKLAMMLMRIIKVKKLKKL